MPEPTTSAAAGAGWLAKLGWAPLVAGLVAIGIALDTYGPKTRGEWVDGLARLGVPCSPVNDIGQVFDDPQIVHRAMKRTMPHDGLGVDMPFIANPIRMSATPPRYRRAPPLCGQHTDELLRELLGMRDDEIAQLRDKGVV